MEKKTIEIDLCGAILSQSLMDKVFAQASEGGIGDIILRNVEMRTFPRLIVDYGDLFETLCEVAKEYKEYRATSGARFVCPLNAPRIKMKPGPKPIDSLVLRDAAIQAAKEIRATKGKWPIIKDILPLINACAFVKRPYTVKGLTRAFERARIDWNGIANGEVSF